MPHILDDCMLLDFKDDSITLCKKGLALCVEKFFIKKEKQIYKKIDFYVILCVYGSTYKMLF